MRRLVCGLLAAVAVAGCGGDGDEQPDRRAGTGATPAPTATASPAATPGPGRTRTLTIYLMRGEKVAPVSRSVPDTPAVASAALGELLEGPTDAERAEGLTTAIPAGPEVLGVTIARGVARVNLSSDFGAGGGSASMQARVAQVVHTLTRFDTVRSVAFALDGRPAKSIGGEGVAVDPPVDRADFEGQAPQILIETPLPRSSVSSPLRITGTANTFEATFQYELLTGGKPIAKGFVTATAGSGTRGTFDAHVDFEAAPGTELELYAYESSAEDGSPLHEVRVPLVAE